MIYTAIIEIGIIFLLLYTPLAFGGVSDGSVALVELVIGLLVLVWLAKLCALRHYQFSGRRKRRDPTACHLQFVTPSILLPAVLFVLLIGLQFVPLPAGLVKLLSPQTYHLYFDAAVQTGAEFPAFLPLTVNSQATEMGLYRLLAYFALFFLMINNIRSPRQITRLVSLIVAIGLFESFYGLFEYFSGRHQIFSYQKSSVFVSGTFVNKNHFAGYMEMVIPLTFGILFARLKERSHTISRKMLRFFDDKYMKAVLVGFLLSLMIGAMLLSGSRGGLLSFAGGMICLMGLAYSRRLLRTTAVLVLSLVLLSAGIAMLLGHEILLSRVQTLTVLEQERSFHFRYGVWKDTVDLFLDFPLLGAGLGTFSHIFPQYQTMPSKFLFTHAENDYVQLLAETGLTGGMLIFCLGGMFFGTVLKAWKKRQARWSIILTASGVSAMLSIVLHSVVDFNLHIPANALLFTVIAAMSYVAAHSHKRSGE